MRRTDMTEKEQQIWEIAKDTNERIHETISTY